MAKPCPNCGNSEYDKKYICGKSYEDAVMKGGVYCDRCVKDRKTKKILGAKLSAN